MLCEVIILDFLCVPNYSVVFHLCLHCFPPQIDSLPSLVILHTFTVKPNFKGIHVCPHVHRLFQPPAADIILFSIIPAIGYFSVFF